MNGHSNYFSELPPEQKAIQARCFHPTKTFVEFTKEEVEQSIPERFEKIVRLYPDRIAVKTRNHTLKYEDLNKAANQIAHAILLRQGERDEPIVLLLDNDAMIAAILGVLKAGKIFVALDPSFPKTRIAFILEDSQAGVVVFNTRSLSLARELVQDPRRLMNIDELDSEFSLENTGVSISPDELSCIVYTSGSTGRPKGVMQNHRNGLHDAMIYTNGFHVSAHDRVSLLNSCSTGHGLKVMSCALLNGAALCPFDLKTEGPSQLAHWLIQQAITILFSVPIVFRELANTLTGEEKFPDLRLIQLTSDTVTPKDVEEYNKHFSETGIFAIKLGATETGSLRRYFIDGRESQALRDRIPVGYAVEDTKILLLDENGRNVEFNHIGEIAAQSRYISPGYWRMPELTQAKFLPDPNGGDQRIYLTGDLGRMRPDGCLEHVGRKDHQVKIRGYSVAIAEIEAALLGLHSIKEAVLVVRGDSSAEQQQLIAYLVAAGNPAPTVSELRTVLKGKLPDYMIPSAFVVMEALPLLPTGKVDRRALPAHVPARPGLDTSFVAPRTRVEETIAGIWSEVLSLDQVGVHDNFFELGGHSLAATRVVSRVIRKFRIELPLQSLFQSPTVAEMAAVITKNQANVLSDGELERIVDDLESMSDDGARRLLAETNKPSS